MLACCIRTLPGRGSEWRPVIFFANSPLIAAFYLQTLILNGMRLLRRNIVNFGVAKAASSSLSYERCSSYPVFDYLLDTKETSLFQSIKRNSILAKSNRSPFRSEPQQSVQADLGLRWLALCWSPCFFQKTNNQFSECPIGRCRGRFAVGGSPSAAFCSFYEENACIPRSIINSIGNEVLVRWENKSPVVRQPGFPFFSTYPVSTFGMIWNGLFRILISLVIKHPE